jgi:hypothetical protein
MKRKPILFAFVVMICTALITTGCAPTIVSIEEEQAAATEAPESEGQAPAQVVQPTAQQAEQVVLRVSVVQYEGLMVPGTNLPSDLQSLQRLQLLVEVMERAAKAISTPERIVSFEIGEIRDMDAKGQSTCQPDMFGGVVDVSPLCFAAAGPDSCPQSASTSPLGFDVYMLESVASQHTMEAAEFSPVNMDAVAPYFDQLEQSGKQAFGDRGVALGTSPLLLIFNPEILGDLPPVMHIDEVFGMARKYPLVLPPHAGIVMAMSQSLLGPEFEETTPLKRSFYDKITTMVGKRIDEVVSTGQVSSLDTPELLRAFAEGEVAWTIHDVRFLRALAAQGYTGSVATARLPVIEQAGGTAMMLGWGVPASSEYASLAWQFVGQLVQDPAEIQWALSNGMVPVSGASSDVLLENPGLAKPWLPVGILERDDGLGRLIESGADSQAWHVPVDVPLDLYNERILPVSTDILRRLLRGEIHYAQGLDEWLKLLQEHALLVE